MASRFLRPWAEAGRIPSLDDVNALRRTTLVSGWVRTREELVADEAPETPTEAFRLNRSLDPYSRKGEVHAGPVVIACKRDAPVSVQRRDMPEN